MSGRPLGWLTLTHSSRETSLARCSVQSLTRRFGDPARLAAPPPFASLRPAPRLYSGAVSFYLVCEDGSGRLRLESRGSVRSRERIQHAAFLPSGDLLAGFEHRVERWRPRAPLHEMERIGAGDFAVVARSEHPHLAGLHTIDPLEGDLAVLSCSAADAVLLWNAATGRVERTLRLPRELYGHNYDLNPETDLRQHYIHDELQTTHVNAAYRDSTGRWAAVSTLISGAVGVFDLKTGRYEEVTRGFVGCHGARFDERDRLYFTDSTAGQWVLLGDDGRIARRFGTGSRWLHDVQQIRGGVHAFALADTNELRVYDVERDELLWREPFELWPVDDPDQGEPPPGWLGNSVQALAFRRIA
jgi:hypothetical protein